MPFGNGAGGTGMENTREKWQLESWHRDEGISDLPDGVCGRLPWQRSGARVNSAGAFLKPYEGLGSDTHSEVVMNRDTMRK